MRGGDWSRKFPVRLGPASASAPSSVCRLFGWSNCPGARELLRGFKVDIGVIDDSKHDCILHDGLILRNFWLAVRDRVSVRFMVSPSRTYIVSVIYLPLILMLKRPLA